MISIQRAAQKSLDAHTFGNDLSRQAEIDSVPNAVKRNLLQAVHVGSKRVPNLVAFLSGAYTYPKGTTVLPPGTQSLPYRVGQDDVIKIVLKNISGSRREKRKYADTLRAEHELLREYGGSFILPHEVHFGVPPVRKDLGSVVYITQEYKDISLVNFVRNEPGGWLDDRMATVCEERPYAGEAVAELLRRSRRLYKEQKLATDFIGLNIGFDTEDELIVIEGQPVTMRDEQSFYDMWHVYSAVESAIARVAIKA